MGITMDRREKNTAVNKSRGRTVAVGVCILCLAVAVFIGYRAYQAAHYKLPFSVSSIESVVLYQHIGLRWSVKKEVTRQEDIDKLAALVNGMQVIGPFDPIHGGGAGGVAAFVSFRRSDGCVFNCFLTDWHDGNDGSSASSVFVDGDRRIEVEFIDLRALWDDLNYEEQEGSAFSEIDTAGLTVLSPEMIPS